jgi:hypothetical protein
MSDDTPKGGRGGTIPPEHHQFKAGQSGNPGGKPAGARNRLQTKFLHALADDFDEHGKRAIEACRESDPARYVQIVAALLPKQVEQTQPLDDLNDEQLTAAIGFLRSRLAGETGAGATTPTQPQQAH